MNTVQTMAQLQESAADIYLDYFNNFITYAALAAYYEMPESLAAEIINFGRIQHEKRVSK
jgi:hypothetical protein